MSVVAGSEKVCKERAIVTELITHRISLTRDEGTTVIHIRVISLSLSLIQNYVLLSLLCHICCGMHAQRT